jgi:hypothetical protein
MKRWQLIIVLVLLNVILMSSELAGPGGPTIAGITPTAGATPATCNSTWRLRMYAEEHAVLSPREKPRPKPRCACCTPSTCLIRKSCEA